MTVDARGQVQTMTDGENQTSRFFYDSQGNRTLSLDATDAGTSFAYDPLERMTSSTDAQGHTSSTEYDAMGNVVARTDANGNRTTYKYDALNRQIEVDGPDGSVTSMGYCGQRASNPCQIVDALGNVTTMTEDKLGRDTATTDALGYSTSQHFDTAGRVQSSTDANGNSTNYQFDGASRVRSVSTLLTSAQYTYDPRGNRLTVQNYNSSKTTTFAYDRANRLVSETTPPAFNGVPVVTTYSYDAAGNRATKLDGNGITTSYLYDHNRRLLHVNFQDGSHYDYAYDARGNRTLEKHVDAGGATVHERDLTYDSLNRLALVNDVTLGRDLAYGYYGNGNRVSLTVTAHASGVVEASYTYRYDTMNRLTEVVEGDGDTTLLSYDLAGNRKSVTFENGMVARYSYDRDNRLTATCTRARAGTCCRASRTSLTRTGTG